MMMMMIIVKGFYLPGYKIFFLIILLAVAAKNNKIKNHRHKGIFLFYLIVEILGNLREQEAEQERKTILFFQEIFFEGLN